MEISLQQRKCVCVWMWCVCLLPFDERRLTRKKVNDENNLTTVRKQQHTQFRWQQRRAQTISTAPHNTQQLNHTYTRHAASTLCTSMNLSKWRENFPMRCDLIQKVKNRFASTKNEHGPHALTHTHTGMKQKPHNVGFSSLPKTNFLRLFISFSLTSAFVCRGL